MLYASFIFSWSSSRLCSLLGLGLLRIWRWRLKLLTLYSVGFLLKWENSSNGKCICFWKHWVRHFAVSMLWNGNSVSVKHYALTSFLWRTTPCRSVRLVAADVQSFCRQSCYNEEHLPKIWLTLSNAKVWN